MIRVRVVIREYPPTALLQDQLVSTRISILDATYSPHQVSSAAVPWPMACKRVSIRARVRVGVTVGLRVRTVRGSALGLY